MTTEQRANRYRERLDDKFADLAILDTKAIFSRLGTCRSAKGEYLFTAGEEATSLYFILEGCFAVQKPVGIGNRSQAVALLSAGALVGESALLAGRRRGATIVAVEDSLALELPRDILKEMEQDNPQLYIALLKKTLGVVSQRLQKSSERLALIL